MTDRERTLVTPEMVSAALKAEDEYEHPSGYRDHYSRMEVALEAALATKPTHEQREWTAALVMARNALAAPPAPNPDLEAWIEREYAGYGIAIRRKEDEPVPGEPFMSREMAKELTRRAVAEFASAMSATERTRETVEWLGILSPEHFPAEALREFAARDNRIAELKAELAAMQDHHDDTIKNYELELAAVRERVIEECATLLNEMADNLHAVGSKNAAVQFTIARDAVRSLASEKEKAG